jgi:hypothetical protein
MTPWIAKGEVFALAAIAESGNAFHAQRVPGALLQALEDPQSGACRCRVLHRYNDPLAAGRTGYRCLKIGTTEAMLDLRLLDDQGRPLGGWRLTVSPAEAGQGPARDVATSSNGFITHPVGPYRHVALVQVLSQSDKPLTGRIPVEILGDQPVVCRVRVDPKAEQEGQHEYDRKRLLARIDESLLGVSGLISELNEAREDSNARAAAIQKARAGLANLNNDVSAYGEEIARLARISGLDIAPLRDRIQVLRKTAKSFHDYIAELERVLKEESDPKRVQLRQKALEAKALEEQAKFAEAIALYKEVLREGGDQPQYAEHLAKLEAAWALKDNEAHPQARSFTYEVWPKLQAATQLRGNIERAKQALQTFIKLDDRLSPLMLQQANLAHVLNMTKRQEELFGSKREEDRQELQTILDLTPDLTQLTENTRQFLQSKPKEK